MANWPMFASDPHGHLPCAPHMLLFLQVVGTGQELAPLVFWLLIKSSLTEFFLVSKVLPAR